MMIIKDGIVTSFLFRLAGGLDHLVCYVEFETQLGSNVKIYLINSLY